MGLAVLEIEVGNHANWDITEKLKFFIESGAIYSVVPASVLAHFGISPLTDQEFRLADRSKISCKKGIALFKSGGRIGGADMIFGEAEDSLLLGAFTLDALGLVLDPLRRGVRELHMILDGISALETD